MADMLGKYINFYAAIRLTVQQSGPLLCVSRAKDDLRAFITQLRLQAARGEAQEALGREIPGPSAC